jgi:type VI secretion system protein ImpK
MVARLDNVLQPRRVASAPGQLGAELTADVVRASLDGGGGSKACGGAGAVFMAPRSSAYVSENLALIFQEVLTATVRVRSTSNSVSDAGEFRGNMRAALGAAANLARGAGYPLEDIEDATFAAVAFLDETVLNSQNPIFGDWLRKPIQQELFGTHTAGEVFFENLKRLQQRGDSLQLADLLEVYYLCLLLGFRGRHNVANPGELAQIMSAIADKIRPSRLQFRDLSPAPTPPDQGVATRADRLVRTLGWMAGACAAAMVLLFITYRVLLSKGFQI